LEIKQPSGLQDYENQFSGINQSLDDTWVTVFGFTPQDFAFIFKEFQNYGIILRHISGYGNWMNLQYQTKLQAQKALSKNGKILNGRIMIGVRPCIDSSLFSNESVNENTNMFKPTTGYIINTGDNEVDASNKPRPDTSLIGKVVEYFWG